jgi:predicted Fe-Mo cluster-binding NifX family protein
MEKIAIAVDNNQVSAHFGRCPSFTIIQLQDKKVVNREIILNPGHRTGFLPKFLAEKDVHTIICGGMGRRAIELFNEKGIKAIVGVSGGTDEVITKYIKGQLKEDDSLCQPGSGKGYGIEKEDRHHK